jgi:integrase
VQFTPFALQVFSMLPIRAKTIGNYRSHLKNHLHPTLGHEYLDSIGRQDIQKAISGLSPQTAATSLAIVKTVFREAISQGLVEESPADRVRAPKLNVVPRKFLSYKEICERDYGKYSDQVHFLALHGLRWGEAVVLTPKDFRDGKILVSKSIHGATKTPSGIREVPQMYDYVEFSKSPKGLRKALHKHGIHIHSLRHTYAYLLKTSGVHVTTAQRLLGHADPRITLGIYTSFREEEIEQAKDLILKKIA